MRKNGEKEEVQEEEEDRVRGKNIRKSIKVRGKGKG